MSDVVAPSSAPSSPAPANTPSPGLGNPALHKELAQAKPQESSSSNDVFEVVVNGKTVKMTRQQVMDNASMSVAAADKFAEASKTRKEVDRIIKTAKENPIEALMDPALGLSRDQIREAFEKWYSKEFIEPERLTPDQRKMKEYEEKVKKYEDQDKAQKLKEEEDQLTQLTGQQKEFLQNQIIEALETSGLPKTKFFASRMAFYMKQNAMNGWDAPLSMIVQQVKNERSNMMSDFTENATAEHLISLLGEGVINKIRQHDLAQLRSKRNIPAPTTQSNPSRSTSEKKNTSWDEVQQNLRDLRSGKKSW